MIVEACCIRTAHLWYKRVDADRYTAITEGRIINIVGRAYLWDLWAYKQDRLPCCLAVRTPTREQPYTLFKHCQTWKHCAALAECKHALTAQRREAAIALLALQKEK